ncbi:MAG: UbiA family prenyltransferase [Flavobacteriales bacterium]|nr:UbiA family prenyltransferase [Flavobacteriales bacterium]
MSSALTVLRFIFFPFVHRLRMGEGGLVLFNALHAAFAFPDDPFRVVAETMISLLALMALYGVNDHVDRHRDLGNAKKDAVFTRSVIDHGSLFLGVHVVLSMVAVLLSLLVSGSLQGILLILLLGVNSAYSLRLKSVPILDIVAVVFWGGLYVGITGNPDLLLMLAAGLMTGTAHVFQMITDRDTDSSTGVNTTLVRMPGKVMGLLVTLSGLLAIAVMPLVPVIWTVLCLVPPLMFGIGSGVVVSWHVSRLSFSILWIASLYHLYGGI